MTIDVARLQSYLREGARRRYDVAAVPPFTLFFHPSDSLPFFNYAIPDGPVSGDLGDALGRLRVVFAERGRRARFEFIEELFACLPKPLFAEGFVEEGRQALMVWSGETPLPIAPLDGLTVLRLSPGASVGDVRDFITTQRRGFDPDDVRPATEADRASLLAEIGRGGIAFLACVGGEPAGAAMTSEPLDGLTELAGLTTLEPFRGRGVGSALAADATQAVWERGLEGVLLTASDERAARMYGRVGFIGRSTMLSFSDPGPPVSGDPHGSGAPPSR